MEQAFGSLETFTYAVTRLMKTGAGFRTCLVFIRTYGRAELMRVERLLQTLFKHGFSDNQLMMVGSEFSIEYAQAIETAIAKIGVLSGDEIDAVLVWFKRAGTAEEIGTLGTSLATIRENGIALSDTGLYGVWSKNGVTALAEALSCGLLPSTIQALSNKGVYPGSYAEKGIDSENKAQEALGEGVSKSNVFNDVDEASLKNTVREHIFSDKHIKGGIMELGESQEDILDKGINIIKELNLKETIKEGATQIKTYIDGIKTEIRIFIKDGKIINFDMFKGWSERDMGNVIYYER